MKSVVPFCEMRDEVFSDIRKLGFTIEDHASKNNYFIFDRGKDSVTNFYIKELHGWRFGIWCFDKNISEDNKNEKHNPYAIFFSQRDKYVDKFKPSCSTYQITIRYYYSEEKGEWTKNSISSYQIKDMLIELKRHPFISFYRDVSLESYLIPHSFMWFYLKTESDRLYRGFKEKYKKYNKDFFDFVIYEYLSYIKNKKHKNIEKIEIKDMANEFWKGYPRYSVNITFNKNVTEEKEMLFHKKYFENKIISKLETKGNSYEVNYYHPNFTMNGKMVPYEITIKEQ